MRKAKQQVEAYKTKAGTASSEVVPKEITCLMDTIAGHAELATTAERTITLHTNYPFLLRAN